MRVLVTGANGFVGAGVLHALEKKNDVRAVAGVRDAGVLVDAARREHCVLGDLADAKFAASQFTGIDVIVHTAARVHVMRETEADPLQAFRQANVLGLQALATAAAAGGVRRFVFVSSIKVNGEETLPGFPYTADDIPAPLDPYGISKHEAEQALRRICENTGMEWVIVRPPLVYGPGVKANFLRLMQSLERGMPLPVGSLRNRRSLVALDNLVDLLVTCLSHPQAANQTFLVSDGDDLSVAELTNLLSRMLSSRSWLLPFPSVLLRAALAVIGRLAVAQRLCGELRVDIEKTRMSLGWQPPVSIEQGLSRTVAHYLECAR
jgi:nucleoside-diphosphate-sugar epimerase